MDVKDFQKDFFEEVKSTAAVDGEGSSAAFVSITAGYLINAEVLPDFTPAFYVGTGRRNRKLRVDGYVLDDFDYTMTLIIADYTGDLNRDVLTKTTAGQLFDRLKYFIEEALDNKYLKDIDISTSPADLVDLIRVNKNRIRKYRLLLITDGFISGRINSIPAKNIGDIPVECQIWDVDRIFRVCFSDIGRQNIEIDFKAFTPDGIPCIEASSANTDDYKSYLCIIPGSTLADVYDHYGSQLLEGNVRSFLSTKVAVNKKIRETILKIPDKFFAYNNGVAATAMDLIIESSEKGKYITYAKDFQIINGGQTTASLSNARHKDSVDLTPIFVQMKLTEIDSNPDRAGDLIRNISRSSNSQNKVSDADFFSTHPFHVRMEQISRRLFAPAVGGAQYETKWFYERARGQYFQAQMRMKKLDKKKFVTQHPKKQVIAKTDLAKVRNTWNGLPQLVSKGAQTNFMKFADIIDEDWANSDTKYNEKYFKESVALIILFKHTETLVTHQPWYEQGYRANIVTYSIALLRKLIKEQFPGCELDLALIWNRQEVPDVVTSALTVITKTVFLTITDPARETLNVTQWCKRDTCWSTVKACDISLNENIQKALIAKDEIKSAEKEAKSDQKVASDLEAQKKVISAGVSFWKQVNDFSIKKRLLSPESIKAMRYALQMPNTILSPYQSQKLLELLERAESEGFQYIEENREIVSN
ncbi:MAG: AIPR family protein [Fermentimonas sp.]|nr:AIPR family protein [Fermentimonas sp.]